MSEAASRILATMSEAEWQASVVSLAKDLGWVTYHTHDSRRSDAGWPDLALCRDRLILLELKRQGRKLEPAQKMWLGVLLDAGVEAYAARPCDVDALTLIFACKRSPFESRGPVVEAAAALRAATRKETQA